MKKLLAALLVLTLVATPIGDMMFNDHPTAEARGFKSGKKGFNMDRNKQNPSNFQKKQDDNQNVTPNKSTSQNKKGGGFTSGGLMKGLFVGGLAGLLFGSLFANMGMLGSILGFMINAAAIIFIVVLIKKIFDLLNKRKKEEDVRPWGS